MTFKGYLRATSGGHWFELWSEEWDGPASFEHFEFHAELIDQARSRYPDSLPVLVTLNVSEQSESDEWSKGEHLAEARAVEEHQERKHRERGE